MNKKKYKGVRKGSVIERDIEIVRWLMQETDPESGQLLSGCCGAPPYMGMEELGRCPDCKEGTIFVWEAVEDED